MIISQLIKSSIMLRHYFKTYNLHTFELILSFGNEMLKFLTISEVSETYIMYSSTDL